MADSDKQSPLRELLVFVGPGTCLRCWATSRTTVWCPCQSQRLLRSQGLSLLGRFSRTKKNASFLTVWFIVECDYSNGGECGRALNVPSPTYF